MENTLAHGILVYKCISFEFNHGSDVTLMHDSIFNSLLPNLKL